MPMSPAPSSHSPGAAALALTGLAFCVWNLLDSASVPCPTLGCALQGSFTLGGLSLWWFGAALFAALTLCALLGRGFAGWLLAGIGLAADLPLLALMLLSAPCFSCLCVALLLAGCYALFRRTRCRPAAVSFSWLLLVWGALFVMNIGQLSHDLARPWAIAAPAGETRASVYFSPSCGACRQLALGMPEAEAARVAWYPVAEDARGVVAIDAMRAALAAGKTFSEAFHAGQDAAADPARPDASLRLLPLRVQLWINRAHVLRSGQDMLPLVEMHGLPQALLRPRPAAPPPTPEAPLPFLDLDTVGQCRGGSAVPCPEGAR